MELPEIYINVMIPFLNHQLTEDNFHEIIAICYAVPTHKRDRFNDRATKAIRNFLTEQQRENNILYNPHRNISLNQSFDNGRSLVSDWLNVSDWKEWD